MGVLILVGFALGLWDGSSVPGDSHMPNGSTVEANVVYGMYSGLALLMDVHHPARSNGRGVLYVPGCAWHAPLAAGATQLKDLDTGVPFVDQFNRGLVDPLLNAGYTVFVINHRAAPRFRYPAAVEDCQRAVRFIRHKAERFGVRADRLGGVGYSSGAHLVSLLGVLDGSGDARATDPVERQSAKLQCVVAGATASDLADLSSPLLNPGVASFLGVLLFFAEPGSAERAVAAEASPLTHASPGDAAHLLFHCEKDEVIPFAHSEKLAAKLREHGVPVELLKIPGGSHMETRPPGGPDYPAAMVRWLNTHLGDGK
jgi:acetyl esterase/lipase